MLNTRKVVGNDGETIAAQFLRRKGYKILQQNYTLSIGEIDLIAKDSEELVFIEVKSRNSLLWGRPSQAVHYRKQQKIFRVAQMYLNRFGCEDVPCRFDVVEVIFSGKHEPQVNHIIDAFGG